MLVGVVGKANVGKSTFFKAATLAEAEIANYPFTTIAANHGVGYVKVECADKEFNLKCNPKFGYCLDGTRFVPIDMLDVAGLVPGAHKGMGRGNEFLDDLRQADALIHVIDVAGATNEKGEPVEPGSYDPANDIKFLEVEIDMWYFGIIKRHWEKLAKQVQQEKQDIKIALVEQLSSLKVTEQMIEDIIKKLNLDSAQPLSWTDAHLKTMAIEFRKATKPMIIAANKIDIPGAVKLFEKLKKEFPDHIIIACSAESELALREAAKQDLIKYTPGQSSFEITKPEKLTAQQHSGLEFIKTSVLEHFSSTGIQQVLDSSVFKLLKYIAVYPVENENKFTDTENRILPDVHLLPSGSTAQDLAYKIHTDIGNKFNCAIDVRTKKRLGKDYQLKNKDVLKIITS